VALCRCTGVVALVSWCRGIVALWHHGAMALCSCDAGLHQQYDYTTLRSATVVFIDNVRAGTFPRTRSSKV
jgi:hypothetical protein